MGRLGVEPRTNRLRICSVGRYGTDPKGAHALLLLPQRSAIQLSKAVLTDYAAPPPARATMLVDESDYFFQSRWVESNHLDPKASVLQTAGLP